MPLPAPEPLFEQLCALRDVGDPTDPRHADRWRVVSDWLGRAFSGQNPAAQDARQEVLISLLRNVRGMRATSPLQAAKWVSTIMRRKHIDLLRAGASDPVYQALRGESRVPDAPHPLDRIAAADSPALTPAMLEQLVTGLLEHVQDALDQAVPNPATRLLRRTQAQAALLRLLCGWDAEAIVAALGYGEPIGKDRLYKWVERGRAPVGAGLDRWIEKDPAAAPIVSALREIVDERRADAGRTRGPRRRPAGRGPKEEQ